MNFDLCITYAASLAEPRSMFVSPVPCVVFVVDMESERPRIRQGMDARSIEIAVSILKPFNAKHLTPLDRNQNGRN